MKLFFSWQSDRHPITGRNFIERALEDAIKGISVDASVEEAVRNTLSVDRDTKGVPGSPALFDTILGKIDAAAAFIPDLTFVATRADGEPSPNPNVLIEYGYALRCLSNFRIIAVMNVAHGNPKDLPFDLAHHRYPITYELCDGASEQDRKIVRRELAKKFESALKTLLNSDEFRASVPKPPVLPLFPSQTPLEGKARFRANGFPLGIKSDPYRRLMGGTAENISLDGGPTMYLRVMPQHAQERKWSLSELENGTLDLAILPLAQTSGSIGRVKAKDGIGYIPVTKDSPAPSVTFIFGTGEIWTINAWTKQMAAWFQPCAIAFEEQMFTNSLETCVTALERLGARGPYQWIAGIEGVDRYMLHSNRFQRPIGPFMTSEIEESGFIEVGENAAETMRVFFRQIYEMCDAPGSF